MLAKSFQWTTNDNNGNTSNPTDNTEGVTSFSTTLTQRKKIVGVGGISAGLLWSRCETSQYIG